ncbi:hypothetical protein [Dactylosporangium sp. CA-233914]|uniref:hypothetical protein n=1 Tax=Dactylosporangium sp. CA-233914 TaxID=3239934 RepID=UPI003D92B87C
MHPQQAHVEAMVKARLLELFDRRSPWHRSLWQVSTLLALDEVLEYADGYRSSNAISDEGLGHVTRSAQTTVNLDEGLGMPNIRKMICDLLKGPHTRKNGTGLVVTANADSLRELARRCRPAYLSHWAEFAGRGAVTSGNVELISRSVAAYLLDSGFSANHLHGWLLKSMDQDPDAGLADVITQAHTMSEKPLSDFVVVVPFAKLPRD